MSPHSFHRVGADLCVGPVWVDRRIHCLPLFKGTERAGI